MFPTLKTKRWRGNVSFDRYAQMWLPQQYGYRPNPSPLYTDPKVSLKMKTDLHRELGADCTWGGLWEDRSCMWAGGYMEETGAYIHLGIDYTVPARSPVCVDRHCKVVHVDNDYVPNGASNKGGWGGRVIVELIDKPVVLLYAHLAPKINCTKGDILLPGTVFAHIGTSAHNGGWSPHLHLQGITPEAWRLEYHPHLEKLDGYGTLERLPHLKKQFFDPSPYIEVP